MNANREAAALARRLALGAALFSCASAQAGGIRYYEPSHLIEVQSGADVTLSAIAAVAPPEALRQVDPQHHIWLLSADLLIGNGTRLRLKSDNVPGPNAYVSITADYGTVDIRSTRVTSWDSARKAPDEEYADFGRAFIRVRSRLRSSTFVPLQSRMDVVDSEIRSLGFGDNESYGLVWKVVAPEPYLYDLVHVYGDVLRSRIRGNYFGLYSSGLRDAQWRGNQVWGSVEYGLAPHNHSDGLLIEGNEVHDNGHHGITVRQDCAHLVIRNNTVWGNGESGIALHRRVFDSVIAGNTVQKNRDSGITLFGATRVAVTENIVRDNGIAGVQLLMNTAGSRVEANRISGSGHYGIFVGRGKGRIEGDGLPRGNSIADNQVYGSGDSELRTGDPLLNHFGRNTVASLAGPAQGGPAQGE
jgi:parallel beta-helix repeat protein